MAGSVSRGSRLGAARIYKWLQKSKINLTHERYCIHTIQALGSKDVLVNPVNLIDHRSIGVPVIRFKNYRTFHTYTVNGRIFPLKEAKKDGFINALLRKL